MIEDKIKQEYEWQHREIGQPTLDELFSKINEALGIELWIWQKTYQNKNRRNRRSTGKSARQHGKYIYKFTD